MNVADALQVLRDLTADRTTVASELEHAAISAVTYDSRRARAGALFVALRGQKADGAEFVPQAADGSRVPWVHLDIAGAANNGGAPHGTTGSGPTGVMVATLLALAEDLAERPL